MKPKTKLLEENERILKLFTETKRQTWYTKKLKSWFNENMKLLGEIK